MSEYDLHSLILACDFRVDDVDQMWKWLDKHREPLASIGAHHVVPYTSIWEPDRVLVTIGIRQADGAYPTQFAGRFAHLMTIGEKV